MTRDDEIYTYANTPEMAGLVGWSFIGGTVGNPELPFVRHDHNRGVFEYTAEKGEERLFIEDGLRYMNEFN